MHGTTMLPNAHPQSQRRATQRPCLRQIVKKIAFPVLLFAQSSYL